MSGWVKWEKDLETDPRFTRMVKALMRARNANALHLALHVTLLSGALLRMWVHADTHIREDNTLDMSLAELDEWLGVPEFSSICPSDWLVGTEDGRIELPDFLEKNGAEAKKKALVNKRVEKHRQRQRNVPALPDQTRPDQTKEENTHTPREALQVPRGTQIDAGNNLTQLGSRNAFSSLLEDWRRDVPECNPTAFSKWIVHMESSGKPMNPNMRLAQARRLAGFGSFDEQTEIVNFCADEKGYHTLIPLADVRVKTSGLARAGPARKPFAPAPTTAELEAQESARASR